MIEKVKSVLLLMLFASSLLLTHQLWYGQKPAQLITEDVFERVEVESPRPLEQVVTPSKIIIEFDAKSIQLKEGTGGYKLLWESLSEILQAMDDLRFIEEEAPVDYSNKVAAYHFQPPLPMGEDLPWLSGLSYLSVDLIELYTLETEYRLVFVESTTGGEIAMGVPLAAAEEIDAAVAELFSTGDQPESILLTEALAAGYLDYSISINSDIFVPGEPIYMKRPALRREEFDRDLLLKSFFVDYNLARVIEEKEGGLIYTDGEKGLRLTSSGLAYSAPRLEEGQATASYPEALLSSSSLISHHGGWPENLRLEEFVLSGRDHGSYYTAGWKIYYDGYPIITRSSTRLTFNNRGLIHYSRSVYYPVVSAEANEILVAPWHEALLAATRTTILQQPGSETSLRLEKAELAYVVTEPESGLIGVPVWRFQLSGEKITLKADTLEQLPEEDLL